jgi:hypothetical protein
MCNPGTVDISDIFNKYNGLRNFLERFCSPVARRDLKLKKVAADKAKRRAKLQASLSTEGQERLWAEMKHEFETTEIGIRELARKFGQKSHTTVLRRQQKEGWRKDPNMIAANVATNSVIDMVLAAGADGELGGAQSGASGANPPVPLAPPFSNLDDVLEETTKKEPPRTIGELAVADQAGAVRAGKRMAAVQQQQILKEIAKSDQIIAFGTTLIDQLSILISSSDEDLVRQIASRLRMVGSKTESLSGLVRAAVATVDKGLAIRRKALSMEAKLLPNAAGAGGEDPPEQVKEVLTTLSMEKMMELRRAAAMLNQEVALTRPATEADALEGVAEEILEGALPQT